MLRIGRLCTKRSGKSPSIFQYFRILSGNATKGRNPPFNFYLNGLHACGCASIVDSKCKRRASPMDLFHSSDRFDVSGPTHLRNPDWEDLDHRRAIAASLVQAVYILEIDRQNNRNYANKWWASFQFDLKRTVVDTHDGSIFGAVFEWRGKCTSFPREVVAFRGTLLRLKNVYDLVLDCKILMGCLDSSSRFTRGFECLRESVDRHGADRVWIAGHSLGAAIGLLAGRTLAENGLKLEAHLFNPPFISPALPEVRFFQKVGRRMAARGSTAYDCLPWELKFLKKVHDAFRGGLDFAAFSKAFVIKSELLNLHNRFLSIRSWVPNLYVNSNDLISSTYIHYFRAWQRIRERESIKHVSHQCVKYLFCFELGRSTRPWHIIPSAMLITNSEHLFHNHHAIRKWWSSRLEIQMRQYVLPPPDFVICKGITAGNTVLHRCIDEESTTDDDE